MWFLHHCHGTGNRTDLRGAFTESVDITFLTSPLQPVSVAHKKTSKPCFPRMSNPLTYPWTALSWWFWMMRQLNGCSSLAWRSSAAKQCIERTGWNNEEDFLNFLLAYSRLFPTRKNFDWLHFQFIDHCNSHLMARWANNSPWTTFSPHEYVNR